MSARDTVLARIADALGRADSQIPAGRSSQPADVSQRLLGGHRHTLPRVSDDLISALTTAMESVLMSVVRLPMADDCASALDEYLKAHGIDASSEGVVSVSPALVDMKWPSHYASGPATGVESVSITPCIAAVAETGSIVTASGWQTPATLNFLPETHVIVLYESQIVRHVDDVFPLLRSLNVLPRAVNFITGPSRTADIEQTIEIGVHGPRRMHVLILPG